ncbi:hypothetical protein [Streptomyces sp. NPDC001401]|uniref:hypothetical protein n=1 Tax=Streptomyces sp. NPDC001401 TaxID=3364570 RepID=UPI0036863DB2
MPRCSSPRTSAARSVPGSHRELREYANDSCVLYEAPVICVLVRPTCHLPDAA